MHRCNHSPVTNTRRSFAIAVLVGPTTLIDYGGQRLICDPTFDPPTDYGYLQKVVGPSIDEQSLGNIDMALVSHDTHPDNLDGAGRALAVRAPHLLTTTAAERLGPPATPLQPWASWTEPANGTVTGVPARHGPADGELNDEGFVNCEVIGFVLQASGLPTVYVSGDNTSLEFVRKIHDRIGVID